MNNKLDSDITLIAEDLVRRINPNLSPSTDNILKVKVLERSGFCINNPDHAIVFDLELPVAENKELHFKSRGQSNLEFKIKFNDEHSKIIYLDRPPIKELISMFTRLSTSLNP